MPKLWTYGCSYTAGFLDPNGQPPPPGCNYGNYYVYRGGNYPKIYPEIIAEELNFKLVNRAEQATAVIHAFWRLTEDSNNWNSGDIVLYQTTMQERYPMWNEREQKWICLGNDSDYPIPHKTQMEFKLNRLGTYLAWQRETLACIRGAKALADSKGCIFVAVPFDYNTLKVISSNPELYKDIVEYTALNKNYLPSRAYSGMHGIIPLPTIQDETKGKIKDSHYGEEGNKRQAEGILPFIRKFL